jgi:hypothetical protein
MGARGNWPAGRRSLAATGHQGRLRRRQQPAVDPGLLALIRRVPYWRNGFAYVRDEAGVEHPWRP